MFSFDTFGCPHHLDLKAVLKVLPFHTSAAQYAQSEGCWKGIILDL